ncbi:MAG: hypothetical protein E5Y51_08075 [Mesorhizobium sp.]|nr:MAG: hypothetical protein E5Y51_08075 [Mesorhizobium sp.]
MISLDGNGCIAGGRKPSADIRKSLAQAVARLCVASSRPKPFCKPFAIVTAATCQDQGSKEKRGLARPEADRLAVCGRHVETAKQPDTHVASPNSNAQRE